MKDIPQFDLVILGGGSAGYAAARTAIERGIRPLVIDHSERLGGLCILKGCMPSKALLASSRRQHILIESAKFGLNAYPAPPDLKAIQTRKNRHIDDFAQYRQEQLHREDMDLWRARASFLNPHSLQIDFIPGYSTPSGETQLKIHARTIILATGSSIYTPDIPGLQETGYLTSNDILEADELPAEMAVLGGGAIALEMATYLHDLGVQVKLIQRSPRLLKSADPELSICLEESMLAKGIEIWCDTQLQKIHLHPSSPKKHLQFTHRGQTKSISCDQILCALGRIPATSTLNLEQSGLSPAPKPGQRISVNSHMQTSEPHIYAVGDLTGPLEVVHMAILQGETAAKNACAQLTETTQKEEVTYKNNLFGVFCHPEIAQTGYTETEARAQGLSPLCASYPFEDHGKSLVEEETQGFVKLIADLQGKLIGGSVIGPHATELIHEVTMAIHLGATAEQFAQCPHYHPTLSEIWTYPAEEVMEQIPKSEMEHTK